MAAIPLSETPLFELKNALRRIFPQVGSCHMTEAVAYSLGFSTNASLAAAMKGPEGDRPFKLMSSDRLCARLEQLGYEPDNEFDFELDIVSVVPGVVSTMPASAYDIQYKSQRALAWRNLMVFAVNEALDRKLFTLRPGDNRFGHADDQRRQFDFTLPNGLPARVSMSDAGYDEIEIHAAVNPKGRYVNAMAGFSVGDAVGMTWIERSRGAWMQTSHRSFHCKRGLVEQLADLDVSPNGFGDRGRIIM